MTDILRPEGRTKEGKNIYRLLLRGNILTDCVCAFFLTAGICQAFLPMTILYNGTGDTLRAAALCILALALLRMRWWIGPLLTSLAALGLCWHFYRTDQLSGLLSYWGAFFAAVFRDGAVDYDIPTGSLPLTVLQYSAVFGIALVLFFILRRMFSIWLLLIALGVSMAAADIYAHFPIDLVPPMAMYIIGLVILLPRVYSRYIKRPRAAMQMIAVPGAVLVVLLGLLITPESRDYARWRGMTNFFHDVGYLIDSPFYSHYQGYTNFGLGSFGYEPVPERLGGPAVLPDWHLLTVVSKHPVLLRGAVMDTYTGSSWQNNTHDGDYRFDSLFFRRQRAYAFDLDMPLDHTDARSLYNAVTSEISFAVTYEAEHYTTLFTSSGTADIAFSNPAMRPDAFFNLRSELYLPYPVPQGSTVFITARMFDTKAPGF
ncbi:MAG: hypothetical protein FWH00_00915, partial [Oscillospiraceae bacterium]|nr:hypothetical protein [Oscillospiraceae bacterium]